LYVVKYRGGRENIPLPETKNKVTVSEVVYEEPSYTRNNGRFRDVSQTIFNAPLEKWFGMNLGDGVTREDLAQIRAPFYGTPNAMENGFKISSKSIWREDGLWLYVRKEPA
jgi:hypothetical protein